MWFLPIGLGLFVSFNSPIQKRKVARCSNSIFRIHGKLLVKKNSITLLNLIFSDFFKKLISLEFRILHGHLLEKPHKSFAQHRKLDPTRRILLNSLNKLWSQHFLTISWVLYLTIVNNFKWRRVSQQQSGAIYSKNPKK